MSNTNELNEILSELMQIDFVIECGIDDINDGLNNMIEEARKRGIDDSELYSSVIRQGKGVIELEQQRLKETIEKLNRIVSAIAQPFDEMNNER